jgi:hypothetical protein
MRRFLPAVFAACALVLVASAAGSTPGTDVRLSNDCQPVAGCGYTSAYTLATGIPYTDQTLDECSISHARQNEPAVAMDPRNTNMILGSSNDYCGVYNRGALAGAVGPIWLGYYRSENGGTSFRSSLVPGYPDDQSPYRALAQIRTASSGDPVVAWDAHGRAFFGSESSDDPAGTAKTFGDVWVARYENPDGADASNTTRDGLAYKGTAVVAQGSSAPGILGVFHDKTAIEADRTGGRCDGTVYFSWARFTAAKNSNIYISRSTDHGATWSNPMQLTSQIKNVQDPDIAITGNGNVYVTWDEGGTNSGQTEGVGIAKSTNCGATFGPERLVTPYTAYAAQDVQTPQPIPMPQSQLDDPLSSNDTAAFGSARDCGDFADACQSGYTFFRRVTTPRSTADQYDTTHEWIYIVYDASKGPVLDTGTTYGTLEVGKAAQTAAYFVRYNGATGQVDMGPKLLDDQSLGHQTFPDISADGGTLHALWWDSRNDSCYSPIRPIGNCSDGTTVPSLDVFATKSTNNGTTWATPVKLTDAMSNGNYEQFDNRAVPFGGDYLTITSFGDNSFGTWTDWRNTRQGTDVREATEDADDATSDVHQCRVVLTSPPDRKGNTTKSWSGDRCPHDGGLDQDIYGDRTP